MSGVVEDRAPNWLEAVVPLLLLVLPGAFALQILRGLGVVDAGPSDDPSSTELYIALQGLNCLLVLAWMLLRGRDFRFGWPEPLRSLRLFLLFMVVWIPVAIIAYPLLLKAVSDPLEPQSQLLYVVGGDFSRPGLWSSLVVVIVLGPVAEEVVFRGYLYGVAKRSLGTRKALLLTSGLFGVIHGLNYAIPLALLGLLFGWLRERSGGLSAPVMIHAVYNSLTVAVALLFPSVFDWVYQP